MKRRRIIKPITKLARIIAVSLLFTFIAGFTNFTLAQELSSSVISSAGETFTASGYSLDFVIGELATESYAGQGVMLTQGFLQGKEKGLAISEQIIPASDIDVYPNPSADMVYITCKSKHNPIRIELTDLQACLIYSMPFENSPMAVNLEQLNPGLYVLRVIFPDQQFIYKKIIKK